MVYYNEEEISRDLMRLTTWRASYWAEKQTYIKFEDLTSIAYLAITKGLTKYDASKNTKLTTYLTFCIDNAIKTELSKESKQHLIKQVAIENCKDNEAEEEEKNKVIRAIQELSLDEQQLVNQYYYQRLTLKEIADLNGTYEVSIHRKLEKIKDKLKENLIEL